MTPAARNTLDAPVLIGRACCWFAPPAGRWRFRPRGQGCAERSYRPLPRANAL